MISSIKKLFDVQKFKGNLLDVVDRKFTIEKNQEQRTFTIEIARRPPGVRLIITDGANLLLGREYRSELEDWDYRLVGGKIFESLDQFLSFIESGEKIDGFAQTAVRNEGFEEAGVIVRNPVSYYRATCGAITEWDLHYYVVRDFDISKSGNATEKNEIIEPTWVTYKQAAEMCLNGSIKEDRSIGVLLKFLLEERALKIS